MANSKIFKTPKFKFQIGEVVKFLSDPDEDMGEVLSVHFDRDTISYMITSKEVDVVAKKVLYGTKIGYEQELVKVIIKE